MEDWTLYMMRLNARLTEESSKLVNASHGAFAVHIVTRSVKCCAAEKGSIQLTAG